MYTKRLLNFNVLFLHQNLAKTCKKNRIIQLFILVIRQWSRDDLHLTPATGTQKITGLTFMAKDNIKPKPKMFDGWMNGWPCLRDYMAPPKKYFFEHLKGSSESRLYTSFLNVLMQYNCKQKLWHIESESGKHWFRFQNIGCKPKLVKLDNRHQSNPFFNFSGESRSTNRYTLANNW